ncbi:MAG TPA: Gfo/Idh/MocA family oxidoreductase [Casimicrobiaceae bacterium]|jgi:myo-inositol 2-dehydrogenase/D-chiro-inositol 1-dehydrogenase|nr:Gfo/Idh/MocA family oxidoreductase [Casimicrobiaceae bacterium]
MTHPRLRVGIAGIGRMGRRHAENLAHKVAESELVAVCSPLAEELEWAKRELGVTRAYTEYEAMLAHAEIDAVFIVTPTTLHAQQIVDALRARKHVFSEKPLSLDVAECRRVEAEAALQPDLKVMIGFVRRFDESYRHAHALIRDGRIGRPLMVRSHTLDQNDPSGFFVRYSEASGGIFVDMSVHDVDAARWLLGVSDAARVFATGLVGLHEGLREWRDVDNGVATCEFVTGEIATIYASRTMAHGFECMTEVIGTRGRVLVGGDARRDHVVVSDEHGVRHECTPTFYERFADAFLREDTEFVQAVIEDRPPPLTLRDATEATRITLALRQSLLERRVVTL